MSSTRDRDLVFTMSPHKPEEALKVAKNISDPWFRCQALSSVAIHTSDSKKRCQLLSDAFHAAMETVEPNRIVTVSSWPLSVLCHYSEADLVSKETDRLLKTISIEPSPVQRADALRSLLYASSKAPINVFRKVFQAFYNACFTTLISGKPNKKGQSALAKSLGLINSILPEHTSEIMVRFNSDTHRQKAMSSITDFNKQLQP